MAIKAPEPHVICSTKELKLRDCVLTLKPYEILVSRVKVKWSDGTWRSIADAPMPDEKFEWEKLKVDKIAGRWILQFWIWNSGRGEAKVQSLHWVVAELNERKYLPLLDQVVRKRKVRATTPVAYGYDDLIPHQLKPMKNEIEWSVGRHKGKI